MKLISYLRVSTRKQAKRSASGQYDGLGLAAQREAVERYAAANDGQVITEYIEVETGKRSQRPELQAAISHARLAKATLVVAKLDRLARNVAFTSALLDSGLPFVCCDNPHANRLTIHLLAAVAEHEAAQVSQRTKDALAAAKRKGVKLGSARPGHWDGIEHLRGSQKGAIAAAKVRTERSRAAYAFLIPKMVQYRSENYTYEQIAERLNEEGHVTFGGSPFTAQSVHKIMKREGVLSNRDVVQV